MRENIKRVILTPPELLVRLSSKRKQESCLDIMNQLQHLVPGVQRRRINADAVEATIPHGVKDCNGWANAVH